MPMQPVKERHAKKRGLTNVLVAAGLAVVALVGVFWLVRGDKRPALALDKMLAKDSLKSALDSWKKGEVMAELKNRSPAIIVGEQDWRDGNKLLDYQFVAT